MNIKTKALLLTLVVFLPPCYLLFNQLDFVDFAPSFWIFVYFWPAYLLLALYFFFSRIFDFYRERTLWQLVVISPSRQNDLEQYNRSSVGVLMSSVFLFLMGSWANIYVYQTGKTDILWLYLLSIPWILMILVFVLRSFFFIIKYFLHEKKIYFFSYIFVVSFIYYYLFL